MSKVEEVFMLGEGVTATLRRPFGELVGIAYTHPRPDTGADCYGYAPVVTPEGWTLVSETPLTLTPSLLCRICGHHGFITDGKWVTA